MGPEATAEVSFYVSTMASFRFSTVADKSIRRSALVSMGRHHLLSSCLSFRIAPH
jgi:hypothetical protein